MSTFLDYSQLQNFYNISQKQEFQCLVSAHSTISPGQRVNTQIGGLILDSNPNLYSAAINLMTKNETLGKVGTMYKAKTVAKIPVQTPENSPRLLSLNIGSFGLNALKNEIGPEYTQLRQTFLDYLKKESNSTLILNLQDVPEDQVLFEAISALGFDLYFVPNVFYHLGKFKQRPDCGQAVLVNQALQNYNLKTLNLSLSFHEGGFYDYHQCFKKYSSGDMLQKPMTLYFTFQNPDLNQIYHISNIYISAFSTAKNRFQSTTQSVQIIDKMLEVLVEKKAGAELIARFTGDFNLYGYDTQIGPFGLPAEPFGHLPAVFYAVLTGFRPWLIFTKKVIFRKVENGLNKNEVNQVKDWLIAHRFSMVADNFTKLNQSKTVLINEFAPSFLKFAFKGAGTSWILDLCIYPLWSKKFNIWYDLEPFGFMDHKTMIVQL